MKTNSSIIIWVLATMVFLNSSIYSSAQNSHITCSIGNCSSSSANTLEFDLYLTNDGSTSLKLNSTSFGITVNKSILADTSDVLQLGYVGVSDLPESITTSFIMSYFTSLRQLKVTSLPAAVNSQSAPDLANDVMVKVGHFLVTNLTHTWVQGSITDFVLSASEGHGSMNTGAVAYVNGSNFVTNFNSSSNRSTSVSCSITFSCIPSIFYVDNDGDGYGNASVSTLACSAPPGYVSDNTDCNDVNASVHPNAMDLCNNIDDNCNGEIDENAITASITPSGTQTICSGNSIVLTANNGTGLTYQWKKGTKNIAGATQQTYTVKKANTYSVRETNGFNCAATSAPVTVNISPTPVASITYTNLNLCAGSVILTATSGVGYSYEWIKGTSPITGATNQNYTVTKTGNYKVEVFNNFGCNQTSKAVKVIKTCKEEASMIATSDLNLYPNPNDGRFTVELTLSSEERVYLRVFDLLGQVIYSSDEGTIAGLFTKELDLHNLSDGTYFVKVIHGEQTEARKIVIEH